MQLASSGGRRLRHAALAARELALEAGRTVTRKELSAAAREAAKALELRNGPRSVLSELVACWGEQEWERLLVWPSNDYLVSRTGLSERGDPQGVPCPHRPATDGPKGIAQREALCGQGLSWRARRRLRLRPDPRLCQARGVGRAAHRDEAGPGSPQAHLRRDHHCSTGGPGSS